MGVSFFSAHFVINVDVVFSIAEVSSKCKEIDIYLINDNIRKKGQPMKNNKVEQILIAKNFGIMFAKNKFQEILLSNDRDFMIILSNFPELYEFQMKSELRIFYKHNVIEIEYFEEICIAAFIDEGYRLKENIDNC